MFTMLMVVISNNLGIMWIAIEATTLASAFLVGFYEKDMAVEAAWKYLIICSVGITLALLGHDPGIRIIGQRGWASPPTP